MANAKKRVAGYCRVSSDLQTKGYSMKDQQAAIAEYCKRNKFELIEVFSDPGKSGADIEGRCGLKRLLMAAERGEFEIVIVKRLDRLSRDLYQSLWIEKELRRSGVEVVSIEQTVDGVPAEMATAFKQIIQVFAELEKNMLVRKMKTGKQRKFMEAAGPVCGNVSYGFKTVGPRGNRRLVEVPEEQEVIRLMKTLRGRGVSYHRIAQILNGEKPIPYSGESVKVLPRTWGGRVVKWHGQMVLNAVNSNHLKGKVSYQGKLVKIAQPDLDS